MSQWHAAGPRVSAMDSVCGSRWAEDVCAFKMAPRTGMLEEGVLRPCARLCQSVSAPSPTPTHQVVLIRKGIWLILVALLLGSHVLWRSSRVARSLRLAGAGMPQAATTRVMRIAPADAHVLEKLWQSWGREKSLKGWGQPWLCNATGVQCTGKRRVSELRIASSNLRGTISSAIGNLISLTYLDLSGNMLTGGIPDSIGSLTGLISFALSNNQLSGRLPFSITSMRILQDLRLRSNRLTGSLPSRIGRMVSLTYLDLSRNMLTGSLPSSIGDLVSLTYLGLNNNLLNGSLPSSIGDMVSLAYLNLGHNMLTGSLPSTIANMGSLVDMSTTSSALGLNNNQLNGSLPSSIGGMSWLGLMNLAYNQLSGRLPSSITGMSSLSKLALAGNLFTGSLPPIGSLNNLILIDLYSNQLTGSLPPSIWRMGALRMLLLGNNKLTGRLPSSIEGMASLEYLDLSSNRLTGSLPKDIGSMTLLRWLDLGHNQLGGKLPPSIGGMHSLVFLNLGSNELTGSIPQSVGEMGLITMLDLSNNTLNGSLPSSIQNMTSLNHLDVSSNSISGMVPTQLSALWGLTFLGLGHNSYVEASIPLLSALADLSLLQHLDLAQSDLSAPFGALPLPWKGLTFLSLQGANVSGTLPASAFASATSLESLNLQSTAIQGVLPSGLASLSALSVMEVPSRVLCPPGPCTNPTAARSQAFCARCTGFCATCPAAGSFKDSDTLLRFQKASNNFPGTWSNSSFEGVTLDGSGHLRAISLSSHDPAEFAGMRLDLLRNTTLKTLRVSYDDNPLFVPRTSTLPATVRYLSSLRVLQVRGRQATLEIPRSLSRLSSLSVLEVSNIFTPPGGLPSTLSGLRSLGWSQVNWTSPGSSMSVSPRVPPILSQFTKLTQLDLSANSFTGLIPAFLSSLRLLVNLDLSGNSFEGAVPDSLSLLSKLTTLNLRNNNGQLSLPAGLATLPLVYLFVDEPWECLDHTSRSLYPHCKVNPSSPFCTRYCPHICTPCYSPPRPPPPLPPPPAPRPPTPPPPAGPGMNVIAGAASAAGILVLLVVVALGVLLRRQRARAREDDGVRKRGVRNLSREEVDERTGLCGQLLGGDGTHELYAGQTGEGESVRVRVSSSGRGRDRQRAERAFRDEVWLLSGIHHRHLQELYGCSLTPGKLFLVFESPIQGSLWGLLRGDPASLTWPRRLKVALTAALGLDYLHSQLQPPVVHRDVKSRSILVTEEFEGKVGAAGLGALEFGDEGSQGYADPSKGEQGAPTTRSDVYAFGVVLLELATGLRPVEGQTHILTQVLSMTASEKQLEGGIPSDLQGDLQQAAESEGEDRSKDIAEADGASTLTRGAFKCFLELGVACCAFKPRDRPSMAQVSSTIEELLYGRSLPAAPFPAPGQVPFPEYAEPVRGPLGPTELLDISLFTEEVSAHPSEAIHGEKSTG